MSRASKQELTRVDATYMTGFLNAEISAVVTVSTLIEPFTWSPNVNFTWGTAVPGNLYGQLTVQEGQLNPILSGNKALAGLAGWFNFDAQRKRPWQNRDKTLAVEPTRVAVERKADSPSC